MEGCVFNKKDEELARNFCSVVAIAIAVAKTAAGAEGSVGLAVNLITHDAVNAPVPADDV